MDNIPLESVHEYLPLELVCKYVPPRDLCTAAMACKRWAHMASDNHVWQSHVPWMVCIKLLFFLFLFSILELIFIQKTSVASYKQEYGAIVYQLLN
jgi:F-box-like